MTLTQDATGALPWYCTSLSGSFSLPVFPSLYLSVYLPGSITPRYSRTTCSCWVTSSHSLTLCIEQSSSRVQHEKMQLIVLKDNELYTLGNMEINRYFEYISGKIYSDNYSTVTTKMINLNIFKHYLIYTYLKCIWTLIF